MVFELEQNLSNNNFLDFYTTVYIASDIGTDQTHSDTNMHTSTPIYSRKNSNTDIRQPLKNISDRINTPLRLQSPLALSSNRIFFNDEL